MAANEDPRTAGRARLSFAEESDIDEFTTMLGRFERGEISPGEWRVFRLARGTYGQRQEDDAQMIRVKVPQGIATAGQLRALADVAERWSRGFAHITTRQNIQIHFVRLHDVEPAMRLLAASGMTTREACGNAIRNVTTCVYAGVSPDEPFDVTPYAEALTRHFLRHPLAAALPRKFKVAFEGCAHDHVKAAINDIGWRARIVDGRRGFRVFAGGGTATMPVSARVLVDFLPAEEILSLGEAIVQVFHQFGDYEHKARNRMKFLIKSLGWERFVAEVAAARTRMAANGGIPLPFDAATPPIESAPTSRVRRPNLHTIAASVMSGDLRGPGIQPVATPMLGTDAPAMNAWRATNVRRQKQPGFVTAQATVPLGDLSAAQFRVLARLSEAFSDGTVRLTPTQNVVFRWVPEDLVASLYRSLAAAGLRKSGADTIADVTSCPGAESCKLAVTQSRGLAQALTGHVAGLTSLGAGSDLDVKVSGCPNGCGQHHVAAIGFQGSLRKIAGRPAPQYFVTVGGGFDAQGATFGRLVAKVPARRAPEALERLSRFFAAERLSDEPATTFFARVPRERVIALLADLEQLPSEQAGPADFVDFAETTPFRLSLQEGECAV